MKLGILVSMLLLCSHVWASGSLVCEFDNGNKLHISMGDDGVFINEARLENNNFETIAKYTVLDGYGNQHGIFVSMLNPEGVHQTLVSIRSQLEVIEGEEEPTHIFSAWLVTFDDVVLIDTPICRYEY